MRIPIWSRRAVRLPAVLGVLLLPAAGCQRASAPPPLPNILIVTLDTTRADHLGTYGYFRDTSPQLDALARESIVFDRAIAPMATTLPTHVSIFTASYPLEHGVLANTTHGGQLFVPSATLQSIATHASAAGYRTAAFVSAAPLKRGTGVEAGFATFDQPAGEERPGASTTDAALAWLRANEQDAFLLWVHYFDAHWPFTPRPPYSQMFQSDERLEQYIRERDIQATAARPLAGVVEESRDAINAYDAEIRYQDAEMGRLLDAVRSLGAWERTAILVVADHGEGLGQHGEAGHGRSWDEQLHVPMLMRVPGARPRRVPDVVSSVDALPTLLGLLRVPALQDFAARAEGRDVLADTERAAAVLSQDTGRKQHDAGYRYSLTSKEWKYFRVEGDGADHSDELFDLSQDPYELRNVAGDHPERSAELARLLEARIAELRSRGEQLRGGAEPATVEADPRVLEQLRALGYLAGGDEPEPPNAPEPSPGGRP